MSTLDSLILNESYINNNETRSKRAIFLLWIVLGLEIVVLASNYMEYKLLTDANNGITVSEQRASMNDMRQGVIGITYFIAYIISAVFFIQWFRRAYNNLHLLKVNKLSFSEGMAAGCWFIPIVNLGRPYLIMKEVWEKTVTILRDNVEYSENDGKSVIGFWWTLWIIAGILGQISFRLSMRADEVNEFITSDILGIISSIITIPCALLTISMVKKYALMEAKLFENQSVIFNKMS